MLIQWETKKKHRGYLRGIFQVRKLSAQLLNHFLTREQVLRKRTHYYMDTCSVSTTSCLLFFELTLQLFQIMAMRLKHARFLAVIFEGVKISKKGHEWFHHEDDQVPRYLKNPQTIRGKKEKRTKNKRKSKRKRRQEKRKRKKQWKRVMDT